MPDELQSFLDRGWTLGQSNKHRENYKKRIPWNKGLRKVNYEKRKCR